MNLFIHRFVYSIINSFNYYINSFNLFISFLCQGNTFMPPDVYVVQ